MDPVDLNQLGEDGMDDEAYDMINAPQFLDFSQLGEDDDEADRFFDTHREEDDFFIPLENLSPTMHLLRLSNNTEDLATAAGTSSAISDVPLSEMNSDTTDGIAPIPPTNDDGESDDKLDKSINSEEYSKCLNDDEENERKLSSPPPSLHEALDEHEQDHLVDDHLESENEEGLREIPSNDNEEIGLNLEINEPVKHVTPVKPKIIIPGNSMKLAAAAVPPAMLQKKLEFKMTVPKPFNLHQTRTKPVLKENTEKDEFKFKAKPAPMKILQGPTGIKRKIETKATQPVAPHFASDDRIRERHEKKAALTLSLPPASPPTLSKQSTAASSTAGSIKSCRPPTPKKVLPPTPTKVQPFSFSERDEEMRRKKEMRIQEQLEQKLKSFTFHANPLPSFVPKLPKKMLVEVTNVEPFKLRVDERGEMRQQAFKSKMEKEEKKMKENKIFHANPPTVIYKKPFEPVLGVLPLAEPLDIKLHSDRRAQEREIYEEQMRQREQEEEERRQEEDAERLERERQEHLILRKQLVHKAIPLKPVRVFQVKSSDKPLTNPLSPAFEPLPSKRREEKKYKSNSELNTAL